MSSKDKIVIIESTDPKFLKLLYINKLKYLSHRIERITIENDSVDKEKIYNNIREQFDEEDEQNPRYLARLEVYKYEKDFFDFNKDMVLNFLTYAFHTFEKDMKEFIYYSIKGIPKSCINKNFILKLTADKILRKLPKLYGKNYICASSINCIRNLVNGHKHGITEARKKSLKSYLKGFDFLKEKFPDDYMAFEEEFYREFFLYITKDELIQFLDSIIEFWEKIPVEINQQDHEKIQDFFKKK